MWRVSYTDNVSVRDTTIGKLRTAHLQASQQLKDIQKELDTVKASLADKERSLIEAQGECETMLTFRDSCANHFHSGCSWSGRR